MPTTTDNPVFEAQLVEAQSVQTASDPMNPFASPSAVVKDSSLAISEGIGRASKEKIDRVIKQIVEAEVSFVAVCFVSAVPWLGLGSVVETIIPFVWLAVLLYAAYRFAKLVEETNGSNLTTVLMCLSFFVPVFGTLMFYGGKRHAFRFLIWNGYVPKFLGAQRDDLEVARMNQDRFYRPGAFRTFQGKRRILPLTLSSFGVVVYVVTRVACSLWLSV